MGKIVITKMQEKHILFLLDETGRPCLIQPFSLIADSILGNIYIGKVSEIANGLQAAFVQISPEQKVFLPFSECKNPMLINRVYDGHLKQGDELIVQIKSLAIKTKPPCATTDLNLAGQYCICNCTEHGISCSKKLSKECSEHLKEAVSQANIPGRKNYGFVLRTNSGLLEDYQPLIDEMKKYILFFDELKNIFNHRVCYTCFYHAEPELITNIKNITFEDYDEIITDLPEIKDMLEKVNYTNVRLYQDNYLALSKLYSLETHLQQALSKKVWLSCGGYLIIEPTEAMLVIDVNSGKGSNQKGLTKAETYLRTNMEAAREIARQLRIRNYSGMIMIDFINMDSNEDNQKLLDYLSSYLIRDKIKTRLVDMTALGIVEITRKKVSKPLDILLG